jgi:hypothetical protein
MGVELYSITTEKKAIWPGIIAEKVSENSTPERISEDNRLPDHSDSVPRAFI